MFDDEGVISYFEAPESLIGPSGKLESLDREVPEAAG